MAAEDERNRNLLQEVWKRKENAICADCGRPDPCWVSCTLGIFICYECSEIHHKIPNISEVKSIKNCWEESQIQFLSQRGNALAKATYEAHIPAYYYHPFYSDCQVLREQWIRAKYERKEFLEPKKEVLYSNGLKEGILWKQGRDNQLYQPRRFLLSEKERCLKYFIKQDEIVDWFNTIRAIKFHHLKVAFPGASDEELKIRLTRNFLREGYMEKTGPKQKECFKKRWFSLDHRRLMYFKDPLDAFAKGEVFLGNEEQGYNVIKGLPHDMQGRFTWKHGIIIVTPDRNYIFTCETEKDQEEWKAVFSHVIKQPMTPQEYAIEANFRIKH